MIVRSVVAAVVLSLLLPAQYTSCLEDLVAEESHHQQPVTEAPPRLPQPRRYSSQIKASDGGFGQKTSPKKTVLDFRIESLRESAAGGGERPTPATATKTSKDDEEEKTLAQQVADGKYGLIQNELFPQGAKRPGIISYKDNPEVPADTADNLGGLDKEEIWLAEDHVLVLRGGAFPQNYNQTYPTPYPPIDDYVAPTRQVQIPKNPKIPPPFPVQLSENGPLQFIRGENGSFPPRPPGPFPFPVPPGQGPPFLPPGAAFLPPVGNLTDFDEDDPSIYYPPKYDFSYPQDNTTAVPPGPLVPGIILPPPPNFFTEERPNEEENETDGEAPPYVGPAYLPSERRPYSPPRSRQQPKRPTRPPAVHTVYPEPNRSKTTTQSPFTSPIYVPNTPPRSSSRPHVPLPTTSPRPNHISIPKNRTLNKDIYIISTEPPDIANDIIDIIRESKPNRGSSLDGISAERHPLRSLIRPQVSVNYIGKVGHLPPSTAFPFPRTEPPTTAPPPPSGHFITFPPTLSVTPVPAVKKFQIKSTEPPQNAHPSHATFFYFEEPTQATPAHENDVSVSPIDEFLKSNLQDHDFYQYREEKTTQAPSPVYIPSRSRPKSTRKPYLAPAEDPPKLNGLDSDLALHAGLETLAPLPPTPTPTTATDGPFIPSNYYATANPANMHFTKFDPTIVDDITMKYFTIFGQKLNNGGTTPLTPGVGTTPRTHVVQAYTPRTTTTTSRPITITTLRPPKQYKPPQQSHFEQFLHEITGEDQSNYIVTHKSPVKIKKPKSRPVYSDDVRDAPKIHHYYLPYRPGGFSEYIEGIYRGSPSTTQRPVSDVQLKPEYQTTARPYVQIQTQQPPPYRPIQPLSHNLGQYLQEVVYPASGGPPRTSNLQYFPHSLQSDILVNYRQPLPPINPQAELLPSSYVDASSSHSNIKVVQPPNLSPPQRQRTHPAKNYYENLPQSGYYRQPQNNNAHAFVAYNLPEESGHFYFLTPQARSDSGSGEQEDGPADRLNHRQAGRRKKHA